MSIKIMTHLVAGFPNREGCVRAMKGLRDGGADILELQIPFSDPIADGPVITHACEEAIKGGFRVSETFAYIDEAKKAGFERIIVMTYANIAFNYGIEKYVRDLKAAGVEAALVPDLPIEDEEGFYQSAFDQGLVPMPVVVINMPTERVRMLREKPFSKVYISIRTGITGKETEITPQVKDFLDGLKEYERFAGFGIRSAEQVSLLEPHADAAVVGSYFTAIMDQAHKEKKDVYQEVKQAVNFLL